METETVGAAESVILGCLLDKADVVYPLTLAEHIAAALRAAGVLDASTERATDASSGPSTTS